MCAPSPPQMCIRDRPHVVSQYFTSPVAYCRQHFSSKVCGEAFAEQDGLQRRIIEKNGLLIAYPNVPRCYHSGVYGYNRKRTEQGWSYEKRLQFLQETVYSVERMKFFDKYNDSVPVALNTSHTDCVRK